MDQNQTTDGTTSIQQKRPADQLDSDDQSTKRHQPSNTPASTPMTMYREPSIFNTRPMDDITRLIHDFIAKYCDRQYVEIEAKLGVFIDKQTRQRLTMDCQTETVIPSHMARMARFESNMPLEQHRYYNELLNGLVNKSQTSKGERIKYRHTRETDRFHQVGRDKWRVTIDQQTGQIVPGGIVEKVRLENLDIHAPMQPLDFRISINLEIPRPLPDQPHTYERNKDRLSYQHGGLNFDLTQVKGGQTNDMEMRHELEVEFIDAAQLQIEKQKQDRKEPSVFAPSIERFVNNIRMLSKHAKRMH
ncbi:CYTH-like domain-containing protein [Absidia repens]|uniref:mRNA-capping enzyme subunit beta n=1 Tax=Absidia repens TaxID=90262 RepID=A0A1X2INS0_9FUNG|nr:CYTH-like domain-containing protein [Absidia repens]